MSPVLEATKRAFGDRAQDLLNAGAIMPVTQDKTPAVKVWKDVPTDLSAFNGRACWGYAVKTGRMSGLTGVDFDGLVIPEVYNTLTRRGFHAWVPYETGDGCRRNINGMKVDQRGDGGYLVFASPTHSVVRQGLLDRADFMEWLKPLKRERLEVHIEPNEHEHPYLTALRAYGYEVRIDWVANRLASTLANTDEGARNHTLYVSAAQVINLGGTDEHVKRIVNAAYDSDLEGREIERTMKSARNAKEVIPVLEIALAWGVKAEAALKARRVRNTTLIDHIIRLSAEQHSLRPLVSIKALSQETGMKRDTISNQLNMLIKDGLLGKKVNPGRQPNGNLHPNNFILLGGN